MLSRMLRAGVRAGGIRNTEAYIVPFLSSTRTVVGREFDLSRRRGFASSAVAESTAPAELTKSQRKIQNKKVRKKAAKKDAKPPEPVANGPNSKRQDGKKNHKQEKAANINRSHPKLSAIDIREVEKAKLKELEAANHQVNRFLKHASQRLRESPERKKNVEIRGQKSAIPYLQAILKFYNFDELGLSTTKTIAAPPKWNDFVKADRNRLPTKEELKISIELLSTEIYKITKQKDRIVALEILWEEILNVDNMFDHLATRSHQSIKKQITDSAQQEEHTSVVANEESEKNISAFLLPGEISLQLMTQFAEHDKMDAALAVFDRIIKVGETARPSHCSLYVDIAMKLLRYDQVVKLGELLDKGILPPTVATAKISGCILMSTYHCSGIISAWSRYKSAKEKGNPITYTQAIDTLLKGAMENHNIDMGLTLMEDMLQLSLLPPDTAVLRLLGDAVRKQKLLPCIKLVQIASGTITHAPHTRYRIVKEILDFAARQGNAGLAEAAWALGVKWKCEPNEHMHTQVVCAVALSGQMDTAVGLLSEMISKGYAISDHLRAILASKLSRALLKVDELYYNLAQMRTEQGVEVPLLIINLLVEACAIRGDVDRTFATAEAIGNVFGLTKDLHTFNALLLATYRIRVLRGKDPRATLALGLLSDMKSLEIKPDLRAFTQLTELVSFAGGPDDMKVVLEAMEAAEQPMTREILEILIPTYSAWDMQNEVDIYTKQIGDLRFRQQQPKIQPKDKGRSLHIQHQHTQTQNSRKASPRAKKMEKMAVAA